MSWGGSEITPGHVRSTRRVPTVLLGIALLGACGEAPGVSPVDGGVVDRCGDLDPSFVVTGPAAPTAPRFECAIGEAAIELEGGVQVCHPWDRVRIRCGADEILRAGGCEPIASDCTHDDPPEARDPGVVLVRPGSAGGDGSIERPFGTIAEAVASGARTIALGRGEHVAPDRLHDLTLIGACPSQTSLRVDHTIFALGNTTLRRLRVTGAGQLTVPRRSELVLDRVEIAGMSPAVDLAGRLRARRVAIHDSPGIAIGASDAESIELEQVTIARTGGSALLLQVTETWAAAVSLTEVTLLDVATAVPEAAAILIQGAAQLDVSRLTIEDAAGHGLLASATASTIDHVVLRRIAGGAMMIDGGTSSLRRVWVEQAAVGIALGDGEHHAGDVVASDTAMAGLLLSDARGDVERIDVRRAGTFGVDVDGARTDVVLRELVVSHVMAIGSDLVSGGALLVEGGAHARVDHALFEGSEHYGVGVVGARLEGLDVEVRSVRPRSASDGYGIAALEGAELVLERASIHDVATAGLIVQDATSSSSDLAIARVAAPDETNGIGIGIVGASSATLRRVEIADAVRWGVLASGPDSSLDAIDLRVRATQAAPCGATTCAGSEGGAALVGHDGATVRVSRFRVHDNDLAGLVATGGITGELTHGLVEQNPIGMIEGGSVSFNPLSGPGLVLRCIELVHNVVPHGTGEVELTPPALEL